MKRRIEAWAFLLAAVLIASVGFLKPVHMDDAAFIRVAEQLRAYPGDPYGFDWDYLGVPTAATVGMPHPPLWPAALAIAIEWGGLHPIALHLPSVLAAWLLALGLLRWMPEAADRRARWIVILSPILVVMAQSSMSDVPALAFTVLGLGTCAQAEREGSMKRALAAGFYLACAGLIRYAALASLAYPCAQLLRAAANGDPRARWRALVTTAIPLLSAVLFQLWFAARYGATHFELIAAYVRFEDDRAPALRLIAFLPALTVAAFAACGGWRQVLRPRIAGGLMIGGVLLGAYGAWRVATAHGVAMGPVALALLCVLCGSACVFLVSAYRADRSVSTRALFLATAMALVVATPAGAARYVLPLACVGIYALRAHIAGLRTITLLGLIGLQGLIAVGMAVADLRASRGAQAIYQRTVEVLDTEPKAPWVRGELGFRYTLERHGARYLDQAQRGVRAGEKLVRSDRSTPADSRFSARTEAALPIAAERELLAEDAFPLRLFHPYAAAGFYGHHAGLLPFAFSTVPHERVLIHRFLPVPDLFDLEQAELQGLAEHPELATDFTRYVRIKAATPHPEISPQLALHLVARRAIGGVMTLRFAVDLAPSTHRLRGQWAEPTRLFEETIPGSSSELRLRVLQRVTGQTVAELSERSAARRDLQDRVWHPFELDLQAAAGKSVWIEITCLVPADETEDAAVAYAVLADLEIE